MTVRRIERETTVTSSDLRRESDDQVRPDREEPDLNVQHDAQDLTNRTWPQEGQLISQSTESEHVAGDPRALRAVRLLTAGALLVTALIHARLAFQLGVGGLPIGRGQLFFINGLVSAILAIAMLGHSSRVWLFAVVLSGSGLLGILASVYFPIPSVGPFPAIDEPTWLLTKAICALAELTVIALWLIRQIAPASPPE